MSQLKLWIWGIDGGFNAQVVLEALSVIIAIKLRKQQISIDHSPHLILKHILCHIDLRVMKLEFLNVTVYTQRYLGYKEIKRYSKIPPNP